MVEVISNVVEAFGVVVPILTCVKVLLPEKDWSEIDTIPASVLLAKAGDTKTIFPITPSVAPSSTRILPLSALVVDPNLIFPLIIISPLKLGLLNGALAANSPSKTTKASAMVVELLISDPPGGA